MDGSALTFVSQGSVREGEREGGKGEGKSTTDASSPDRKREEMFFFSACGKRRVAGGDEIARVFSLFRDRSQGTKDKY